MDFKNYLENLFNTYSTSSTIYNWDELKKIGKVTEEKFEDKQTGLTTITRTFDSLGGTFSLSSSETFFTSTRENDNILELKSKLKEALKDEDYLKAAEIKNEIDTLINVDKRDKHRKYKKGDN